MATRNVNDNFDILSTKFSRLIYERTKGDVIIINETLDALNILDYRYPIVKNTSRAVLLVNNCCTLIPPDDHLLVSKCCQLFTNLINRQQIPIEGATLSKAIEWILQALKQKEHIITVDLLVTLDAFLRTNNQQLNELVPLLITANGPLLYLCRKENLPDVVLLAVQCLEACTAVVKESLDKTCVQLSIKVFMYYLTKSNLHFDSLFHTKLLISCLRGIHNIVLQNEEFVKHELGLLLGITKTFMVYGIRNVPFIVPAKLMPSALSIPEDAIPNFPRKKKPGKVVKRRKQRAAKKELSKSEAGERFDANAFHGYIPATVAIELGSDNEMSFLNKNKLTTSDSDYSDNEASRSLKMKKYEENIRQSALSLFFSIVKVTERRTIFSYWSHFIPDGSPSVGSHSLITCILKDPSSKGKIAGLNVLLTLLTISKPYLLQAEHSEKTVSFTPFSVTLGFIIKELHKYLCLALRDNSSLVVIQVLKCLAALVPATPYHRLAPGLINKIVRNVKEFVYHKDTVIQAAAFIVIGGILNSEPTVLETKDVFTKSKLKQTNSNSQVPSNTENSSVETNELEYADFSSDEENAATPSGTITEMPWILAKCLENLGIKSSVNEIASSVKLESLQILSAISGNYFGDIMAPYLPDIARAIENAFLDKHEDVLLHAGRAIEFIGQALDQYITNKSENSNLITEKGLYFWQALLNGSFSNLIQNEENAQVRAAACDCLGSIGLQIFEQFPRDKQLLVISNIIGCSRDEDSFVKGAAVRALAICAWYPSLREDSGFVVDTAEAIYGTLNDKNLTVRIKSSWSLGYLSDALVLYKCDSNVFEEIPEELLHSLLHACIKACSDNDKVKTNAARVLGNLLQILPEELLKKVDLKKTAETAINVLVNNATAQSNVKVRWNSCYALGNLLKNSFLFENNSSQKELLFDGLMEVVMNFRNFKVRANAALALSKPTSRKIYDSYYYSIWVSLLKALENSETMEDFNEYKHRDQLVDQICLTLGHLTTFLAVKDLTVLQDYMDFYFDLFKKHMHKVLERLLPEKSTVLYLASEQLIALSKLNLTIDQKEIIKSLSTVFQNDL